MNTYIPVYVSLVPPVPHVIGKHNTRSMTEDHTWLADGKKLGEIVLYFTSGYSSPQLANVVSFKFLSHTMEQPQAMGVILVEYRASETYEGPLRQG